MRRITAMALAGLGAALLIAGGFSLEARQEKGKEKRPSPKAPPAEKPGYEMERLKDFEGTWDGEVTFCKEHAGGGTVKGIDISKIGLGGFWLISDHKCMTPKGLFEGRGLLGYDQKKGEYVLATANSTCSQLGVFRGSFDEELRQLILNTEMIGPDGKPWELKAVYTPKDENHYDFNLIASSGDVKDCPCVSISYVRRGTTATSHRDR